MKNLFALWFVVLCGLMGGLYFSYELSYIEYIWNADSSKLCFLISAMFVYGYGYLGYLLFYSDQISKRRLDIGFEIADYCMSVGMLGTVVGFIIMTTSFTTVDFSDVSNIKDLFTLATNGMSTALYTTAFGLVSSIILRAGYYVVSNKSGTL